jgi:hypothetical protein
MATIAIPNTGTARRWRISIRIEPSSEPHTAVAQQPTAQDGKP